MGNIGDSISDTAPSVGTSGPGYATTINSLLTELRARLISRIPMSSLLVNSTLDMNGQAITNGAYITLANEAISPVASPVNRVAAFGGNLWWVSPSGALQLTNGAALNSASLGGITGDYSGAGPMQFRYTTADTRYDAYANYSTGTWAYVRALSFDIAAGATSAIRARLAFGGAGNVTYTLPAAVPAGTQILTMAATGQMANDGVLGANQSITVSGTGTYKHGDRVKAYDFTGHWVIAGGTMSFVSSGSPATYLWRASAATEVLYVPQGLEAGMRIKKVKIWGSAGAVVGNVLITRDASGAAPTNHTFSSSGNFNVEGYIDCTLDSAPTLTTGERIFIYILSPAGVNCDFHGIEITYDRP